MNRVARGFIAILLSVPLLCVGSLALAQNYPTKPIRVIVPYPPGGTSDILARLIGNKITEAWRQQVIVDNRTGAGGNIGAEIASRATPDGYTLFLTDIGNLSISPVLYPKLPFDIIKDFIPITTISYSPHLLTVHPKLPVSTTEELIAYAKARPGKLNIPTSLGGAPHLAGMMFAQRTGINWVFIPTKGGSQSTAAIMAGEGDVLFLGILQTITHVNSGRLKLIAVSSAERLPNLPKTPTISETLPGFVTGSWQGILAPSRTPPELVTKLQVEIQRILKLPDVNEILVSQGTTPLPKGPQETRKWLGDERARWAKVVKESGFKLE